MNDTPNEPGKEGKPVGEGRRCDGGAEGDAGAATAGRRSEAEKLAGRARELFIASWSLLLRRFIFARLGQILADLRD